VDTALQSKKYQRFVGTCCLHFQEQEETSLCILTCRTIIVLRSDWTTWCLWIRASQYNS